LFPLLENNSGVTVLAIDGRCGAGKSSIAALLAERTGGGIVCMDDFFLPAELRTAERYATPGGNIHHERFVLEVLPFLRSGAGFTYRVFDCNKMDYNGVREITPSSLRIIEGAYSHHPVLGDYMDVRVFSDVDSVVQYGRIKERSGSEAAALFIKKWIPLEEAYLNAYSIREKADMVL
jgi:uridine kinase